MRSDRHGNLLTTVSDAALASYQDGIDRLLASVYGFEQCFEAAVAEDEAFALAHLALARARRATGAGGDVATPLARARELESGLSVQERGQVHCLGLLLDGDNAGAWRAVEEHVRDYPRDVLVAQTGMGVFGLIGFSGRPGREAEHLAWTTSLAPHYGDDWWFLGQHGFAQVEVGQLAPGRRNLERSLEDNPRNANSAHYQGHVLYEYGQHAASLDWLDTWLADYDHRGHLTCHLYWHVALSAIYAGDVERVRRTWLDSVAPEVAVGAPLNVLTDGVALLCRAQLAGMPLCEDGWRRMSDYAAKRFPLPGIAFADVHAALGHAMAGERERLDTLLGKRGDSLPDLLGSLCEAFAAVAEADWERAVRAFTGIMAEHERIGGSRAQRDLLEYLLAGSLLRQGYSAEASRWLQGRRPLVAAQHPIAGLAGVPAQAS